MNCPDCGSTMTLRKSLRRSADSDDSSGSPVTDDEGTERICPQCGHEIDTVSKANDELLEKGI